MSRRPGRSRPTTGVPTIPSRGGSSCRRGAGCILSPNGTPSAAPAVPARSCAAPSSAWRWSASHAPPRRPNRSGSGGGGPPRPTWPRSSKPLSPATRSRRRSASSRRRSNGPPPNCGRPRRQTAGPGCCCWPLSNYASRATRSLRCACPGSGRCPRRGARVRACAAAFRISWRRWAVPPVCQNPAAARPDAPKASAHRPLHASRPSN
jgi:hypothetical protein